MPLPLPKYRRRVSMAPGVPRLRKLWVDGGYSGASIPDLEAEQGQPFKVPRLMSEIQGTLEFADTDVFMEYHDWSLLDYSPKMDEQEFIYPRDGAQLCNRH